MEDYQSRFADVNGQRLHYISVGQGDLIIFVHGLPEFWREWDNQLEEFGRDHQAVALDMRGYNLSSKPAEVEAYHAKHLVEDLRGLAEHLGHQKFTLVAHDWGGAVAWSTAMRYPERVAKLVIINSPHPAVFARELLNNPAQQAASQYMLLFRSAKAEQILAENNYTRLLEMVTQFGSMWDMAEDVRLKYRKAWSQPGALTGGLNYYRASPLYPPTSPEDEAKIKGILDLPPRGIHGAVGLCRSDLCVRVCLGQAAVYQPGYHSGTGFQLFTAANIGISACQRDLLFWRETGCPATAGSGFG